MNMFFTNVDLIVEMLAKGKWEGPGKETAIRSGWQKELKLVVPMLSCII